MSRKPALALFSALLVLTAACSSNATTYGSASPTSLLTPLSTTTTETVDLCGSDHADQQVIDIDGDGLPEIVFMIHGGEGHSSTVGVCADGLLLTTAEMQGQETELKGFLDLDKDKNQEILISYSTERGTGLRALVMTARGLKMTTLDLERWIDPPDRIGQEPFSGATYHCEDWDGDGRLDLLATKFRPADNEENVSVEFIGIEGLEAVRGGVDQYETTYELAADIWAALDRCSPDSPTDFEVDFGANGWGRIPLDPDVLAGSEDLVLTAIAYTGGRMALLGLEAPNPIVGKLQDPSPLAWWSGDGLTWNRSTVEGTDGEFLDVIARRDGSFVASGRVGESAAVWISEDGSDWRLVRLPAAPGSDQGVAYSVVETEGLDLVVVGAELSFPDSLGAREDSDAAVWVLAEGSDWRRIRNDPALGEPGYQPNDNGEVNSAMLDATWLPGVGVVAVGYRSEVDPVIDYPPQHAATWASSDGADWSWYEPSFDAQLLGVTEVDGRAAAYGTAGLSGSPDGNVIVLVSDDGAIWTDAGGWTLGESGFQSISVIRPLPAGGWIALGTDQSEFEVRGAGAAWTSEDLFAWHREAHDPESFGEVDESPVITMKDAVVTDDGRLIVIGVAGESRALIGGGSVCCLYEPMLWVYDSNYDEAN